MSYETHHPEICKCLMSASQLVEMLRKNPTYELEARFGTINGYKFTTGVNRIFMDSIIEWMQKSAFVNGEDEWKEETDVFFEANGKELRTRVTYDSNHMCVHSETTEKKRIRSETYVASPKGMDVRLSLKTENIVLDAPNCVNASLVRIKQRRRFKTQNNVWAFDFSMTWSGRTKDEAERAQMENEPVLEVECEFLNDMSYLQQHSDTHIAASILLKMMDLLPRKTCIQPLNG